MVVKFERGLGHLARIVPRGRHATYPTVGHVDSRPVQRNGRRAIRVCDSEPGRSVVHAQGHRRVPFAVSAVSAPHPPRVPCHAPRRDNVRVPSV